MSCYCDYDPPSFVRTAYRVARVQHRCIECGHVIAPDKGKELKSVALAVKRAGENAEKFELVIRIAAQLSHDIPIAEKLLDGLWYINERMDGGIENKRFVDRMNTIGARKLVESANKAAAYFVSGGAKVWATGMMDEINKGLRNKFVLRDGDGI